MTDPTTLNPYQLVKYVRQLQNTVRFWQGAFAGAKGFSSGDELVEHVRSRMIPGWLLEVDYLADRLEFSTGSDQGSVENPESHES